MSYTSLYPKWRLPASEQSADTGTQINTYGLRYAHRRNGALATQTMPSGRVTRYAHDGPGRPETVAEQSGRSFLNHANFGQHVTWTDRRLGERANEPVRRRRYNRRECSVSLRPPSPFS